MSAAWTPLEQIAYGFCIYPYHPAADSPAQDEYGVELEEPLSINPYLIQLETGDEVYAFEQIQEPGQQPWYRGYVVSTSRYPSLPPPTTSSDPPTAPPKRPPPVEEPQVSIGIFPSSHIQIREHLSDAEGRLSETYAKQQAASASASAAARRQGSLSRSGSIAGRMETLPEEPDEDASHPAPVPSPAPPVPDNRPAPPLPSLKCNDETAAGGDEPLVDEIACALREYLTSLHAALARRDYALFNVIQRHIEVLHAARRQLLAQTLSKEEVVRLRAACTERLVRANVDLGLDVLVRHPRSGALVSVEADGEIERRAWVSGIRMYAEQVSLAYISASSPAPLPSASHSLGLLTSASTPTLAASEPILASRRSASASGPTLYHTPSSSTPDEAGQFFHIFLELKAFVANPCGPRETAELFFSLYSASEARFLTEDHMAIMTRQGVPLRGAHMRVRTLFRDLSKSDVSDDLYLVCRIVRNGALKLGPAPSTGAVAGGPGGADLPADDAASVASVAASKDRLFRRPLGCAVLDLTTARSEEKEHVMPIFVPVQEGAFATLHQDIIASRTREFEKSPRAEMLIVNVKTFHGTLPSIMREHAGILASAPLTSRLGFPDAVFPSDVRNDLYCKLWSGDFSHSSSGAGSRLSVLGAAMGSGGPRNVQVSVEARRRDGTLIEGCLFGGTGEPAVGVWDSTIFLRNDTPTWGEMIKLASLSPEVFADAHLFFTFRHRTSSSKTGGASPESKPFAWAYLPLFPDSTSPTSTSTSTSRTSFLPDASHTLVLYRCTSEQVAPNQYFSAPAILPPGTRPDQLALPARIARIVVPSRDSLIVRTFLCSTRWTQNAVLLKLLAWEKEDELQSVLAQFPFVGEPEIVKFLAETFDALFGILASSRNDTGQLDSLVFDGIVFVLGIVQDRRFSQFGSVLDVYIQKNFAFAMAASPLTRCLQRLLAKPADANAAQHLRSAIKVLPYLVRFIVRARELQRERSLDLVATSDHLEDAFRREVGTVLASLNALMARSTPSAIIGTQTLALQHFAGIVPELAKVYPSEDLVGHVIAFAEASTATKGRILVWRLLLYRQIAESTLFDDPAARPLIVPALISLVKPHLGKYDEYEHVSLKESEPVKDAARVIWLECARLAVGVVAAMLDKLHAAVVDPAIVASRILSRQEHDNVEDLLSLLPRLLETYKQLQSPAAQLAIERHRSPTTVLGAVPTAFPSSYPSCLIAELPPTSIHHSASKGLEHLNCTLGEIAAVMMVLVLILPRKRILSLIEEYNEVEGKDNLARFFSNIFTVSLSILRDEAFPRSWLNVSILAHRTILKLAEAVSVVFEREFIPPVDKAATFDSSLWKDYFAMFVRLLSSDQLVIEEHTPQKRRAVWRLAGDIRGEGAQILLRLWDAIGWPESRPGSSRFGGYQVQFPDLVADLLELCLSHHDELRNNAVQMLYSMIVSEYHLNGQFEAIEAEIVDKLDRLFMDDTKGDEVSRTFFVSQLRALFEAPVVDASLRERVSRFLDSVDYFLDLLLSIRNLPEGDEFQDDRLEATLKLMTYIRTLREEIYVKYLHGLVNMHTRSQNFAEAGLTLKLHADLHEWNTTEYAEALPDLDLPRQTHFTRKETLLSQCLEYLSAGKAYEVGIQICKELAEQYETRTYDYAKLANVFSYQASLLDSIVGGDRHFPEYFRVGFYGGFPPALRGKQYIYRGIEYEKINGFCDRMQNKHPNAQIIRGAHEFPEELQIAEGQFLLITSVSSEFNRSNSIFSNPSVPEPVRKYHENNTDLFSFTRAFRKDIDVLERTESNLHWIEKTLLQCESSFPTVLRRSEIIEMRVVEISPIENALDELEIKRRELAIIEAKYASAAATMEVDGPVDTDTLAMTLNAVCDSPPNTGITLYRRVFLNPAFIAAHPEQSALVERLQTAIVEHARLIKKCLTLHEVLCSPEMVGFHITLETFFAKTFAPELSLLPPDPAQAPDLPSDLTKSITNGSTSSRRSGSVRSKLGPSLFDRPRRERTISAVTSTTSHTNGAHTRHSFTLPRVAPLNNKKPRIPSFYPTSALNAAPLDEKPYRNGSTAARPTSLTAAALQPLQNRRRSYSAAAASISGRSSNTYGRAPSPSESLSDLGHGGATPSISLTAPDGSVKSGKVGGGSSSSRRFSSLRWGAKSR